MAGALASGLRDQLSCCSRDQATFVVLGLAARLVSWESSCDPPHPELVLFCLVIIVVLLESFTLESDRRCSDQQCLAGNSNPNQTVASDKIIFLTNLWK